MKTVLPLRLLFVSFTAIGALSLCGCGTVEGFGEDLQKVGRKLEDAAENVQHGDDGSRY